MAAIKTLHSTSLAIEVENGTNSAGATVYKKKNFTGVKSDALAEDVLAVANAIASVLKDPTRDVLLNDTSKLTTQE